MRRLLPAALIAFGCASQPTGPPAAPDLPVMEVPALEERATLLLLADHRLYDPFTVDRLREADAGVRADLALTLGRVGDPRGVLRLSELVADPEPTVRRAAAFSLGLVDGPSGRAALARAVRDPDRETGRLAVEALARLDTPLAEVLAATDGLTTEELWPRLLPALFRFAPESALPVAEEALVHAAPELHRWAVYGVARGSIGPGAGAAGAPLVRGQLAAADPWVRGWAARALGAVGEGGDLDLLRPLLDDTETGPVVQALRAAQRLIAEGKAAPPPAWRERLLALLADERTGVRIAAHEVAGAWLLDETLGDALARTAQRRDGRESELALLALAGAGEARADGLVRRFAASPDGGDRVRAAEAAAQLEDRETLATLAADREPAVRVAALGPLLESEPERWLDAALGDEDPGVRATALERLAEDPRRGPRALLAAMGGGVSPLPSHELAGAGIRALAARALAVEQERDAIALALATLAEAGEYLVRRSAAAALEELGVEAPPVGEVEAGGTVETYSDRVRRSRLARFVRLATDRGDLDLELACPQAPLTCLNFLQLANQGFYDGLAFHRVIPDFVVQAGDPRGDGLGGPGYAIRDEPNLLRYERGVVGMALSGPDTGGSQFFITLSPQPHLDADYTAFGRVAAGEEVLDAIEQGDRIRWAGEIDAPGGRPLDPSRVP